jgi:hypothetical protein
VTETEAVVDFVPLVDVLVPLEVPVPVDEDEMVTAPFRT